MSEKTRKIETENTQIALDVTKEKPSKQKHNSKRRKCKKNKASVELEDAFDSSKVDEVVNYLCSTISMNESEAFPENDISVNVTKPSSKIAGVSTNQSYSQNSKCSNAELSQLPSTKDLSSLLENLQVHASKNPIKSQNITDFLNIDLLKKTKCESLSVEELLRLKQEKLNKRSSSNEEQISIPNESLKEYFNLSMIRNSPGTSVIRQIDSSSMRLVSEIEETFYSNVPKTDEKAQKSKYLKDYFNVDALMTDENSLVTSIKSTSKLLVNELEKTLLQPQAPEKNKKGQKKKVKNKKANIQAGENETPYWNERVFFNSNLQKSCSSNQTSLVPSLPNKKEKRQQSLKSPKPQNDFNFPRYSSPEELKSLSNFGVLLSGIIRINQKNYKEAYITAPDKGMDILIEGIRDRNRALEGDEVYFVLKAKEHHRVNTDNTDVQRTAVIVAIKAFNHDRGAIGTLNVMQNKNNNFALFSPRDSRLPRIRIRKCDWPKGFSENSDSFRDRLYYAKISDWNDVRYADGIIVKEVGLAGDLEAETDAILLKYGLDVTPYSDDLKRFMPPASFNISEYDFKNREDFRNECIFTIDPQSAVDLDDAVSCKFLPNGNYEIGVHIADVSYFLDEGTPLDKAVSERATTVYLVQKAYHMLPFELCRLCSLTPGEDRFAFSVIWEVTSDLEIVKHRFTRSVINSCVQLSYEQVQSVLDNSSVDSTFPKIYGYHSTEKIKRIIMQLNKIAVHLRSRRFGNGALRIDQKKIYFSLDENKFPTDYKEEIHEPSHQLIEEFMLLANITVAEKLNATFPKLAFLRSHPPPLPYCLKKLQKTLEKYGIILDISTSGSLQASLLKYFGEDTESAARMLVLNNALAKPMCRARYFCGGLFSDPIDRRHYALSVPLYTHFTSPIRRYADVMVHRLLAASLQYCDPPSWTETHVQRIAANCNERKYAAKMAQEMSIELYFTLYIGLQGDVVCEAVVSDIKDKSFDCIGLSTGIHQRLYFEHIKGSIQQEKKDGIFSLTIVWPKDESHDTEIIQVVEMFSIVRIQLKRTNVLKIEAELLRNY